jgi:hypothetical protein
VIEDYNGAIAQLNVAINIDTNSSLACYIRGNVKENIRDISSACNDGKLLLISEVWMQKRMLPNIVIKSQPYRLRWTY